MELTAKVIQGDCLELMRGLPDQSIGMVLADLPYGVTACHWDKVIDLAAMWVQFKRLIQPKRACVFTATQPFTTDLICSNRDWFKYSMVWAKSHSSGHLTCKVKPLQQHEDILIFGEEGALLYNPQTTKRRPWEKVGKRSKLTTCYNKANVKSERTIAEDEAYPRSITYFPHDLDRGIHPTQKPVALFEYLIRTYTNPGDVVLDPTAGSMTTAIAAMNTGRGYVCIEKDPDEYRKGLWRVQAHIAKPQQISLLEQTPTLPTEAQIQLSL